jgi:hypothetical protein
MLEDSRAHPPRRLMLVAYFFKKNDGTTSSRRAQPNSVSAIGHDTDQPYSKTSLSN